MILRLITYLICASIAVSCESAQGTQNNTSTFSIKGVITGKLLDYSVVELSIGSKNTHSGTSGNYIFNGLQGGSYRIIPSLPGYRFEPESLDVIIDNAHVSGINFIIISDTE